MIAFQDTEPGLPAGRQAPAYCLDNSAPHLVAGQRIIRFRQSILREPQDDKSSYHELVEGGK